MFLMGEAVRKHTFMPNKKKYDPNLEAHLAYVMKQKHTRGDLARAINSFNARAGRPFKDSVIASHHIKAAKSFENPTTGNTRYITCYGKDRRTSRASIRVIGEFGR